MNLININKNNIIEYQNVFQTFISYPHKRKFAQKILEWHVHDLDIMFQKKR